MKSKAHKSPHFKHWIGILVLLAVSVFSVQLNSTYFQTSLLTAKKHAPFDGTVYPIQEVPDWSHTTSTEQKMSYHDIPKSKLISIPTYRNDYLTFASKDLVWGNKQHDVIRNTKITFSVAYAGSYDLTNGGEGKGSHPAVDIKTLAGTPVYAIANGLTTKVGNDSNGFGNHVVIEHQNVPSPDNASQSVDLYSSYSHMSKVFVSQGEVVKKGQVIGEVGATGSATTNHLHFQIDTELAPWHPYWPFTNADAKAAGVSFWEAVTAGVGKDNVYKYTYNPFKWVSSHLNTTAPIAEEEDEEEVAVVVEEEEEEVSAPVAEADEEEEESSVVKIDFSKVEFEVPNVIMIGNNDSIKVSLLDSNGDKVSSPSFDGQITVTVNDSDSAKLNTSFLKPVDFKNGVAELKLYANREAKVRITASIAQKSYESREVSLISSIKPFARFGVVTDGLFSPNSAEKIQIQALDADGVPTPNFNNPGTIELSFSVGNGTFSKSSLDKDDFSQGVAEVEFYGEDGDVVVLATYGKAKAESKVIKAKLFTDLSTAHEYYNAVSYLFKKGTVQGYPDGSFQPSKTVSRVEALKFIFSGMDKGTKPNLKVTFKDAYSGQWYSDFVATANSLGIVQGYPDGTLKPEQGVNRVEFLKMLINTLGVKIDPVVTSDPYDDVNNLSWFAPYVQYAKDTNIFPVEGSKFHPSNPMNRAEVAEVIYRMLLMQSSGAEKYSVLLESSN